jgi:hypothetical protein
MTAFGTDQPHKILLFTAGRRCRPFYNAAAAAVHESAPGTKRTSEGAQPMSAFGGKRTSDEGF